MCKNWNASLSPHDLCRGTLNSRGGHKNEAPPIVIGEDKLDITSSLWKDEDESIIYSDIT